MQRRTFTRIAACGPALLAAYVAGGARVANAASNSTRYRFSGGQPELSQLDASVDKSVQGLPALVRSIARRRLLRGHRPSGVLELLPGADRVELRMPGKPLLQGEVSGSPFSWRGVTGESFEVRIRQRPGQLRFDFRGKHGKTELALSGLDHPRAMVIRLRANDDRLSAPLAYRLSYLRA